MNLFQRPQHISINFKENGGLILFRGAFDGVDKKMKHPIHKLEKNMYLIDMDDKKFFNRIIKKLGTIKKPKILHLYSTDNDISINDIKNYEDFGFKILYEYVDEISENISRREILAETYRKHKFILKNTDYYVVTTADKLYNETFAVRGDYNLLSLSMGLNTNIGKLMVKL